MTLKFDQNNFECLVQDYPVPMDVRRAIAERAQQIFDNWIKENGRMVYQDEGFAFWAEHKTCGPKPMKALLINIGPIEKCAHPKEKVQIVNLNYAKNSVGAWVQEFKGYQCECGAKVQPKEYEEI